MKLLTPGLKRWLWADRLIGGGAQSVQSAEDLLGLCAWNIYPNVHAIGARATTIQQKDALVAKDGLLTIGLRNTGEVGPTGVSWSMLLAYLRFYGKLTDVSCIDRVSVFSSGFHSRHACPARNTHQ